MKLALTTLLGITILGLGCGSQKKKEWKIIDQTRELPASAIWDREFNASRAGHFRIEVTGKPPYRVSLVDDSVYQKMKKGNTSAPKEGGVGVFLGSESNGEHFEAVLKLPKGKYWLSIENWTEDLVSYQLIGYAW